MRGREGSSESGEDKFGVCIRIRLGMGSRFCRCEKVLEILSKELFCFDMCFLGIIFVVVW